MLPHYRLFSSTSQRSTSLHSPSNLLQSPAPLDLQRPLANYCLLRYGFVPIFEYLLFSMVRRGQFKTAYTEINSRSRDLWRSSCSVSKTFWGGPSIYDTYYTVEQRRLFLYLLGILLSWYRVVMFTIFCKWFCCYLFFCVPSFMNWVGFRIGWFIKYRLLQ